MSENAKAAENRAGHGRVKLLVAVQILTGLFYLGCVPFLLYLTTTPQIHRGYDAASAIYGLRIGALVCGLLAVVTLTAALGLKKNNLWAYKLGAGIAWFMTAILGLGLFDERSVDWEVLWIMLPYLALAVFFLLPNTRLQIRASGR